MENPSVFQELDPDPSPLRVRDPLPYDPSGSGLLYGKLVSRSAPNRTQPGLGHFRPFWVIFGLFGRSVGIFGLFPALRILLVPVLLMTPAGGARGAPPAGQGP